MKKKDYVNREDAVRARRKHSSSKKLGATKVFIPWGVLAASILAIFSLVLYFMPKNKPESVLFLPTGNTRQRNTLPPKPEGRWRYIKELENCQVGVRNPTAPSAEGALNTKSSLAIEQHELLEKIQADMQQNPTQLNEVPYNAPSQTTPSRNTH
ncbi:Cell division protein FtsN [Serratia symbiotica]|nr:Cell division protein FtsN [Serratia symbiotica]